MMVKDSNESTPKSSSKLSNGSIGIFAAQCGECGKWRVIPTQEEYEEIRSKLAEEPFSCKQQKPDLSCDDPTDIIEYDATRTWVMDKPGIPKTPVGFKRSMVLRKDFSKLDTYYVTPAGKRLKSRSEVASYLQANPRFEDVPLSEFSFSAPKVMEDTIPAYAERKNPPSSIASCTKPQLSVNDA